MRFFRPILLVFTICLQSFNFLAQKNVLPYNKKNLVNGFAKALEGEKIAYSSMYPKHAKEALLNRCSDGKMVTEWLTDTIPSGVKEKYIYFNWLGAYNNATSTGTRNFDLYINDEFILTFTTYSKSTKPNWKFNSKDSIQLSFEMKMKDANNDDHGLVYLRVPTSKYKQKNPLKIKIIGQKQNSVDWYMTFEYAFKEKIDFFSLPLLVEEQKKIKQLIRISVLHFGLPEKLAIRINNSDLKLYPIQNGVNDIDIAVDSVSKKTYLTIEASIGTILKVKKNQMITPVIYREINLIHHSHTDIGYSHIQEDVIKIHNKNILDALKLIEKTKSYPSESQFKWHIESSWVVENFMKIASEKEKTNFINEVKNKKIIISGVYANLLTGLCTPEELDWITDYSVSFRDNYNVSINTAMFSDVPGQSWSLIPTLAKKGIRYFSNGPNYVEMFPDKGDRVGSVIKNQGNKAFWWKSATQQDSILMWTCGKGYSSWHGIAQGGIYSKGVEKISDYMNELDSIKYPYDMVHWRYNIVADNGPTDSTISDFVKNWNEKYISPKLILANVSVMFERFEKKYGTSIPIISGDFTPYWEDGAYSTAKEETDAQLLSEKTILLENLARQKDISINQNNLYQAKKHILLFHEHTWGAWCSTSKPDDDFTTHQWIYKKNFLDTAIVYVAKIENEIYSKINSSQTSSSEISVINTLAWVRDGYVEIKAPKAHANFIIKDDQGNVVPIQKTADNNFCFIAINIPVKGEKKYHLIPSKSNEIKHNTSKINYKINNHTGAIKQLNTLGKNWIDTTLYSGLMQALYVKGLNPAFFSTTKIKSHEEVENGAIYKKTHIVCEMEGTNEVTFIIKQFHQLDYLQLSVIINKKMEREKESIHIALPFDISNPIVRIGIENDFISPNQKQIEGSNKDFFSVQRWIDVSNTNNGVTVVSPQSALFEIGDMVNEEHTNHGSKTWKEKAYSSSTIFLYAMNNYWHTNYKADQSGEVNFDVFLKFHNQFVKEKAIQFGYEMTQPIIGTIKN